MSIVMNMHWPEVSLAQYEQVRGEAGWEAKHPEGARLHVAWFGEDGFHALDLWESQAHFEAFHAGRLVPAIASAKIEGAPKIGFAPAHALFLPDPRL